MKYCADCDRVVDDLVLQCPGCGAVVFCCEPRRALMEGDVVKSYRVSSAGTIAAVVLAPAAAPILVLSLFGLPLAGVIVAAAGAPDLYGAELLFGIPGLWLLWRRRDFRWSGFLWVGAFAAIPVVAALAAVGVADVFDSKVVGARSLGGVLVPSLLFLSFGVVWGALFRALAIRRVAKGSAV